jgi:hypothetical protein
MGFRCQVSGVSKITGRLGCLKAQEYHRFWLSGFPAFQPPSYGLSALSYERIAGHLTPETYFLVT